MSAIYAFAATIAGVAECRSVPAAERLTGIRAWQRRLHAAVAVERSGRAPDPHEDVAVVALAHSIRSLDLPMPLLDDLVSAFCQDTMTTRYASWAELFDYCRFARSRSVAFSSASPGIARARSTDRRMRFAPLCA
jgi:Phytoene/squalene synthetase